MSDTADIRKEREARSGPLPKGLDLGYEDWSLNRLLMLAGPTLVVLLFSSLVVGLHPWLIIFVGAASFVLAMAPAYRGELAYQRIGLALESVQLKISSGGKLLPDVDEASDVSHERLRDTGLGLVPITGMKRTSDSVEIPDNRLVGFASTLGDPRSAYMFSLEPTKNLQMMDPNDRAEEVHAQALMWRRLHAQGIKRTLVSQLQMPVDTDPINEHHLRGRLYTGPKSPLEGFDINDADPVQQLILRHGISFHNQIRAEQPECRQFLTVRLLDELVWGAHKVPPQLTSQQWASTPLQRYIKLVEDALNAAGFKAEWLGVLDMLCMVQVSLDPYNAEQIYADYWQDLEDTKNGKSVVLTRTYMRGFWPRPVIVTPTGIQTGSTFHSFVVVTNFNGAESAELSFMDDYNLWWESGAFVSHFVSTSSGKIFLKEQGLKIQLDLTEQLDEHMGTKRPRRERRIDEIEAQYRKVSAVNASIRGTRFTRLSSGNAGFSEYMAEEAERRLSDCGASVYRPKGMARNLRLFIRSVVGSIR